MKRMLAVFNARNKEFFRDRSSLMWNLLFPFLLLFVFYFVFGQSQPMFKVGVVANQDGYLARPQFMAIKHIQFIPYQEIDVAVERLERHQIDLVLDIDHRLYWVNEESSQGYMAEQLLSKVDPDYQRNLVRGTAIRYVDWVLPGLIGMNIMFSSLFGVGYAIVRYRKNGVLKRLNATPLSAVEFISAQILSRLLSVLFIGNVLFFGGRVLLSTLMVGQYVTLLIAMLLGALALISLGLVVASRLRSEEFTGGLLNMATWPMMGLSQVWFPLEGAPHFVHVISNFFPLTHLVSAMREVMVDGASIIQISDHLTILALMSVLFLVLGSALFNWKSDSR
jgi:ABC-type multidrug transport system permease subunit